MHGANLICGEVLVELLLEGEGRGRLVVGVDAQLSRHPTPGELLLRDLVVAAAGDNVIEDFEEVDVRCADFRFRIEGCATFGVVVAQPGHELFILGGAVDGMRRRFLPSGSHFL